MMKNSFSFIYIYFDVYLFMLSPYIEYDLSQNLQLFFLEFTLPNVISQSFEIESPMEYN